MNQSNAVLSDEQFEEIGGYIRSRFHQWLLEDRELNGDAVSGQLNRIESSLEASVVLARERFDMATERFDINHHSIGGGTGVRGPVVGLLGTT